MPKFPSFIKFFILLISFSSVVVQAADKIPAATKKMPPATTVGAKSTPTPFSNSNWPCKSDVEAVCKGMDQFATPKCLWEHLTTLSPRCKKFHEDQLKQWPCAMDAQTKCVTSTVPFGSPEIQTCLSKNISNLSKDCQKLLATGTTDTKKATPSKNP